MSKTSYLLLTILLACLGVFLYVQYGPTNENRLSTLSEEAKVTGAVAHSTLSLTPSTQTIAPGQTRTIAVSLDMQEAIPTVLQFELAYDPNAITPTVLPGKYFREPIILINNINPRNGRISYALKCSADFKQDPNADCGINANEAVAIISYTVNPLAISRETSLNIMPKTLLETQDNSEVILKTSNAKIVIQGAALPPASPSAVISQ